MSVYLVMRSILLTRNNFVELKCNVYASVKNYLISKLLESSKISLMQARLPVGEYGNVGILHPVIMHQLVQKFTAVVF